MLNDSFVRVQCYYDDTCIISRQCHIITHVLTVLCFACTIRYYKISDDDIYNILFLTFDSFYTCMPIIIITLCIQTDRS